MRGCSARAPSSREVVPEEGVDRLQRRRVRAAAPRHHRAVAAPARRVGRRRRARADRRAAASRGSPRSSPTARPRASASAPRSATPTAPARSCSRCRRRAWRRTPIPRSVAAGGSFAVDAVVDARYRDPELFVTRDDGTTERARDRRRQARARSRRRSRAASTRGRQQVEITASDAAGSTVLANFPVWCGAEPPLDDHDRAAARRRHRSPPPTRPSSACSRWSTATAKPRASPALLWDDRVAAVVARALRGHAQDEDRRAHLADDRLRRGSRARRRHQDRRRARERRARVRRRRGARGPDEQPRAIARTCSSPSATHVGIGVVLGEEVSGRREMFVDPGVHPRAAEGRVRRSAADLVRERINSVRPVGVNATLPAIAQELADGLAAGKTRDSLWPGARKKLDALEHRVRARRQRDQRGRRARHARRQAAARRLQARRHRRRHRAGQSSRDRRGRDLDRRADGRAAA